MLDPAEKLARSTYGDEHPMVAQAKRFLGETFRRSNRPLDAERYMRDALAMYRAHPQWDPNFGHAECEWYLARLLQDTGRSGEAIASLRAGMLCVSQQNPDPDERLCFLEELAVLLLKQTDSDSAADTVSLMREALVTFDKAAPLGRVRPWLRDFA